MNRLFHRLSKSLRACKVHQSEADTVAVALSGGPDSLALAALVSQWHYREQAATEPPLALVVDHQLRPESAEEAACAAAQADAMGLRSRVLTVDWAGAPPAPRHKMRAAREARYALLLEACRREGSRSLLTAHHAGDQAETFLLRVLHASGVDGLSCMPLASEVRAPSHSVRLLRPLLRVHKQELVRFCQLLGLHTVDDPTNDDPRYQRNRLRQLIEEHERGGAQGGAGGLGVGRGESGGGGGAAQRLVGDVLLLQQICARTSAAQGLEAGALLRQAVLHTSPGVEVPRKAAAAAAARWAPREEWSGRAHPPRWLASWPARTARASRSLGSLPHAILQAFPFAAAHETVGALALARLLQAVAGRPYPPALADCTKLARRLGGGALVGAFTGGGCLAQPLVRSKGRYVLVVPQTRVNEALRLLREEAGAAHPALGAALSLG